MKVVQSLNKALDKMMAEDDKVILLGEDIRDVYGGAFKVTRGLSVKYPDRVINTPISEAGIVGMAIGMALQGLKPIVEIMFGDFLTLAADQIINHAVKYSELYGKRMNLVIRTPMGGGRGYGATHSQSLEKLFCGIPGLVVIAPSVYHDVGRVLRNALNLRMPVLFIEDKRMYMESIHETPCNFIFIESESQKKRIEIFTYGYCVELSVKAAEILTRDNISSEIYFNPLISHPNAYDKQHFRVTIEEGTARMAWGSQFNPDLMITTEDSVIPAYGESEVLPSVEKIVKAVREHVCKNSAKVQME